MRELMRGQPAQLAIFDALLIDGRDTRQLPLTSRREARMAAVRFDDVLWPTPSWVGAGLASFETLHRAASPFTPLPRMPRDAAPVHWVEPHVEVDVAFLNYTAGGMLRQARYVGQRGAPLARDF